MDFCFQSKHAQSITDDRHYAVSVTVHCTVRLAVGFFCTAVAVSVPLLFVMKIAAHPTDAICPNTVAFGWRDTMLLA